MDVVAGYSGARVTAGNRKVVYCYTLSFGSVPLGVSTVTEIQTYKNLWQ